VYHLVAEKSGSNCCAVMRQFGVSYNTAAVWRRKIRDFMVRAGRAPLQGRVEVDEFILGGPAAGCRGRRLGDSQALVLAMVEEAKPGVCGRIRLEYVPDATTATLNAAIKAHVAPGSTIRTDGLGSYRDLPEQGFSHKPVVLGKPKKAHEELPLVHRVTSLFKRFVLGVLQGTWTHPWLQSVLDEFVFRFNRRNSTHRPQLFNRLLEEGMLRRTPTRQGFLQMTTLPAQPAGLWS
jgi:transposase-like protein